MTREIMFRGRRIDNGEWVFGSLIQSDIRCYIVEEWNEATDESTSHCVEPTTVGQFTGNFDRIGNKLFEGDLIKFMSGNIGVVIFSTYKSTFSVTDTEGKGGRYGFVSKYITRVGNIYDNPELLKP